MVARGVLDAILRLDRIQERFQLLGRYVFHQLLPKEPRYDPHPGPIVFPGPLISLAVILKEQPAGFG